MTATVGVVGATGFVGSACADALLAAGLNVVRIPSVRVRTSAKSPSAITDEARFRFERQRLWPQLDGCDVLLNASGLADSAGRDEDALFGANALMPAMLALAARESGVARFVQISSAAVQGMMDPLTESWDFQPFSPYSRSKTVGEICLAEGGDVIIYRPTSVHGPGRQQTARLAAYARSGLACVAGDGSRPTPQVHIANVAAAATFLCDLTVAPPPVVLHPSECWTTASILSVLGGHEPLHVPTRIATAGYTVAARTKRLLPTGEAAVRRTHLLLFGQAQLPGWLDHQPLSKPADIEAWGVLARTLAQTAHGGGGRHE